MSWPAVVVVAVVAAAALTFAAMGNVVAVARALFFKYR